MSSRPLVLCLGVGILAAGFANAGGATNAAEILEAYVEAMNARDSAAAVALFQPSDRVVSVVNGQVAVGVEAIRESRHAWDTEPLEISSMRATRLGEESFLVFATLGTAGERTTEGDAILLTLVVEKSAEGWRIVHQHATETETR